MLLGSEKFVREYVNAGGRGMIPQQQPNRASCLATSFAMCIGIPVEKVFQLLKHDGTEICFPQLDIPNCYRGFHPCELIWIAHNHNLAVSIFQFELTLEHPNTPIVDVLPPYTIMDFLPYYDCTITFPTHAVAWSHFHKKIIDPNGSIYDLPDSRLITSLYVFIPIT